MAVLTYVARGGPLDGQTVESRYPKGFLLVDKPRQQVWLYDAEDGTPPVWVMRVGSPFPLDELLQDVAAAGFTYDVRALDDND